MDNEIIVELRQIEDNKFSKAKAEITLQTPFGEITITRMRVVHQDGKDPWVAFPEIPYQPKDSSEKRYLKVILPSKRLRAAISEAVLNKYGSMKFNEKSF